MSRAAADMECGDWQFVDASGTNEVETDDSCVAYRESHGILPIISKVIVLQPWDIAAEDHA